jgi:DNA-directed RNA polymerase specialized sigma24 family protein
MDNASGGGKDRGAQELILRTVAAHAESLLPTARRHSFCLDDAQDAYQRALEIFMANAERLDPARAAAWLHVVVKREAQAIRRARQRLVTAEEVNLDAHESASLPTPEERLLTFDMLTRSAEALQRLKPQELRALWLKAQGHSYSDIGAITGWSYTKVNRCVAEDRRAFLERYAGIESGEECLRWRPVISAMADGEATQQQILELRPHLRNCPGCRATLKALQDSHEPLAAILPIPLIAVDVGMADHVSSLLMRIYEGLAGGIHERAVHAVTKAQLALETAATGKMAVVAASAAAAAGGGLATVERTVERESTRQGKAALVQKPGKRTALRAASNPVPVTAPVVSAPAPPSAPGTRADHGPPQPDTTPHGPHATNGEFDLEEQVQAAPAIAADPVPVRQSSPDEPRGSVRELSPGTATSADDEFGP